MYFQGWGRYKTIMVFPWFACALSLVLSYRHLVHLNRICRAGHIILIGNATPPSLAHPNGALVGLIVAIAVIGLGASCIKANVSPMIAEQYQGKLRKKTLPSGEVVIVSPPLTYQSICICIRMVASTVLITEPCYLKISLPPSPWEQLVQYQYLLRSCP
jgi:dipeptide/tripeptide permease